jgi:L-iditol 2-dehydrogenase
MRVAVYYRNDDVRIEKRPLPRISPGELLVRMKACGICGTDVMEWYRKEKAPRVLGHEMAGEVAETAGGMPFKEGDRVFVSHHVPCNHCRYCLRGDFTACEFLHRGNFDPGGFSEYIRVPEENVRKGTFLLPDRVTYEEAAMIEPLGCVVAGQNRIGMEAGKTVLVIGSGVAGLLHIRLAKSKGMKVVATDINEFKLDKARESGADHCINADSYRSEELKRLNQGSPADIVIVCAAAKKAIEDAIASVDRKGALLLFAVPESDVQLPSSRFWRDEISLFFSYGAAPADLEKALELIHTGTVAVKDLISHLIPFSSIAEGFRIAANSRKSLKVVITGD